MGHWVALPSDIPLHIDVDVTDLSLEKPITVADLPVIPGVKYLVDDHEHVFSMIATRASEVEEVATSVPEPEVAAKGKKDEEE